jgi:tetratricopeptide (TPR) repeat protein
LLFNQALRTARAIASPFVVGRVIHALGQLAQARDDGASAEDLAQQALRIALDAGQRQGQAVALFLLGRARELLGLLPEAAAAYGQARDHARELSAPALRCDAEAGLASVALAEGRIGDALPHADAIFTYLAAQALAGCEEPGGVVLTGWRVFRAAHDAREQDLLRLGAILLERRIAALPLEDRQRYAAAFPARQELLAAWHEHQEAPVRHGGVPISLVPSPSTAQVDHIICDALPPAGPQATAG